MQGAVVSDNPLDFLSCILYIRQGHAPSQYLVQLCSDRLDVLIQDVDEIQGERPQWLRGVPTVVTCPNHEVLTGSRAIAFVEGLRTEPDSCPVGQRGASLEGLGPEGPNPGMPGQDMQALFRIEDEDIPNVQSDQRYVDQPREKKNAQSLEDLIRRRGGGGGLSAT